MVAAFAVAAYLALTVVFAVDASSMAQPFRDAQYLGHQAREIMTHAIVTLPIGAGGCLLLAGVQARAPRAGKEAGTATLVPLLLAGGVAAIAMCAYVGFAALHGNAMSHGQSNDLVTLVLPHFFEHTLTYVVTPLVAATTYALIARRER